MYTQFSCELMNCWVDFTSHVATFPTAVPALQFQIFLACAFYRFHQLLLVGVRCHSCDGVLHVASKHICQQHYSSQAILLGYASKFAFVFIYLGREDSCHVEESYHLLAVLM